MIDHQQFVHRAIDRGALVIGQRIVRVVLLRLLGGRKNRIRLNARFTNLPLAKSCSALSNDSRIIAST